MRKLLIIYSLLVPLILASAVRATVAMSEIDSNSPWSSPIAATTDTCDDDGVSIANLFTAAPRFDSVASCIVPTLGLAHWTDKETDRLVQPHIFLFTHSFLI